MDNIQLVDDNEDMIKLLSLIEFWAENKYKITGPTAGEMIIYMWYKDWGNFSTIKYSLSTNKFRLKNTAGSMRNSNNTKAIREHLKYMYIKYIIDARPVVINDKRNNINDINYKDVATHDRAEDIIIYEIYEDLTKGQGNELIKYFIYIPIMDPAVLFIEFIIEDNDPIILKYNRTTKIFIHTHEGNIDDGIDKNLIFLCKLIKLPETTPEPAPNEDADY